MANENEITFPCTHEWLIKCHQQTIERHICVKCGMYVTTSEWKQGKIISRPNAAITVTEYELPDSIATLAALEREGGAK